MCEPEIRVAPVYGAIIRPSGEQSAPLSWQRPPEGAVWGEAVFHGFKPLEARVQCTNVPKHQSTRSTRAPEAPEHQKHQGTRSTRTTEAPEYQKHQNTRTPEHQSTRAPATHFGANNGVTCRIFRSIKRTLPRLFT